MFRVFQSLPSTKSAKTSIPPSKRHIRGVIAAWRIPRGAGHLQRRLGERAAADPLLEAVGGTLGDRAAHAAALRAPDAKPERRASGPKTAPKVLFPFLFFFFFFGGEGTVEAFQAEGRREHNVVGFAEAKDVMSLFKLEAARWLVSLLRLPFLCKPSRRFYFETHPSGSEDKLGPMKINVQLPKKASASSRMSPFSTWGCQELQGSMSSFRRV